MSDGDPTSGRRVAAAIATLVASVALLGSLIGLVSGSAVVGAVIGASTALAVVGVLRARAVRIVLSVCGARPLGPGEFPRLKSLVDGLGLAHGLPKIDLYVIDDPAANALVADGPHDDASVVVTSGLIDRLDRVELEGVVGQLLGRIKSGEARASTLLAVVAGGVPTLADLASRRRDGVRSRWGANWLFGPLLRRSLTPSSTTSADLAACRMTRYPPGLIGALETIREVGGVTSAATTGTAHLWIEHPLSGEGDDSRTGAPRRWFVTHPTLDERISLLREL